MFFAFDQNYMGVYSQFGGSSSSTAMTSPSSETTPLSPSEHQGPPPAKKDYDECRIQVKTLDIFRLFSRFTFVMCATAHHPH